MKVLVVEDNNLDAQEIVRLLAEGTVDPIAARHVHTCAAALRALQAEPDLDVVLLDLALPDTRGAETVATLVREYPAAPFIVLSGTENIETAVAALRLGVQDFLVKGRIGQDQLSRAIRYAIERKRIERRLEHLAGHDALTGLLNRHRLRETAEHAIANADRHGSRCALLFIDLDGFKAVNDELGHAAGDEVLVDVAGRLSSSVRRGDTAARLGGDEFAVVLDVVPDREAAETVAAKIRDSLLAPAILATGPRPVGASIGLAMFPEDGRDVDSLLESADRAMYAAKSARAPGVDLRLAVRRDRRVAIGGKEGRRPVAIPAAAGLGG